MLRPGLLVLFAPLGACASDVVLPDAQSTAVCGDGVVEAGEGCDTTSPGCAQCLVVPGWTCRDNACSPLCGDGVVGSGPSCAGAQRDTACDMTGFWAVRETDYACDSVFHSPQTSSNWYLYELAQQGDAFEVVASLDCGVHVTGSATIDYTLPSIRAVMYQNPMDGSGPHGHRHGSSMAVAGGCAVSIERWYMVRGAVVDLLPVDFTADAPLGTLPPLPTVADPTQSVGLPPGATDPDGDGFPGVAFRISGLVTGIRDSAQRTWKAYTTDMGAPVPASALQLSVPGGFDLQESVLHVSECGTSCGLLTTAATASQAPAHTTLAFLGKTLTGPRVSAVVAGPPGKDIEADLVTCANLRLVLPHQSGAPAGACGGGAL